MQNWRISTLQWTLGGFCALMGSLMLVAPHQFAYLGQGALRSPLPFWGAAFILAGVTLFSIVVMRPRRSWSIVYHWFAGLLLLSLAASFALTSGWINAVNYSVMGLGLILSAHLARSGPIRRKGCAVRPDLLTFLIGLAALLTGLGMLVLTEQPNNPVFNLTAQILGLYGLVFTTLGGLLVGTQLAVASLFRAEAPEPAPAFLRGLVRLASPPLDRMFYLLVAVFFLLFMSTAALPTRLWLAVIYYGIFGLALALLPWLLPVARRVEANALHSQLSLVLAVCMSVPLILTVALVTDQQERDFKADILDWQRSQAEIQTHAISDFLLAYQAAVQALAKQPRLMSSPQAVQQSEIDVFASAYSGAAAFALYDADGNVVVTSTGGSSPPSLASQPIFEMARWTGKVTRVVAPSEQDGLSRIRLGAPVVNDQGIFAGLVYVSLYTEYLADTLIYPNKDPLATLYLVDDTGRLMVYSDPELSGSLRDFSTLQPVRSVLQSLPSTGSLAYHDADRQERWVSYARLSDPPWTVIIDKPAAEELAPVYAGRNLAYGILLASVMVVSLIGMALARALTRPLEALLHAVHNLAEGDETMPVIPPSTIPEVSRLASAFSLLRTRLAERTAERAQAQAALREINQELELRVAERTWQLEQANLSQQQELAERQRAQTALLQRENEMRSLVENVPDGIIRYDANLLPIFFSLAGKRIAGWVEQALTEPAEDENGLSRTLGSVENTLLRQVFLTGKEAVLELSIPSPEGLRYFETRYLPEFASEGTVGSVLAIWRDLTGRRIVEEALRNNEERLRISLSHAGIWVFSLDCDLRYTWVYNAPAQLHEKVFIHKSDAELFAAEDAERLIQLKRSVLRRGERARQEIELHFDGRVVTYDMALEPLRSDTGDTIGILGSAIDVTERNALLRKTEQQQILLEEQNQMLRGQKELLETIFEVDPGGIAVVVGENLEFQFANPAYRALTPYPEVDPVGHTYLDIWPPSENFRGSWLLHRILETGKPLQLDWYPQEFPNGELRYFSFNVRRVPWGSQPALLLTMWDTTSMEEAYRRAENSAVESRLRADEAEEGRRLLQTLMQYIPEGIAIADLPEGLIRTVSQYGLEMLHDHAGEAAALEALMDGILYDDHLRYWQLYHLDGLTPAALEETPLCRALQAGEVVLNEEWLLGPPHSQQIFILCNAAPLRDEDGEVAGALFSWRDITERKRAEAALETYARQLERSNQELQDFAFIASHDLQEPLRKIQAFGDRLKEHTAGELDESSLDFLNRMQSASVRMRTMIDDLLALSRVTTRGRPFTQVSLDYVARDVLSDLEIRIERSNAVVEIEQLPTVEGDPSQLRQLLQNLIANALKFHKPGEAPHIKVFSRIEPSSHGKRVQIMVQDQGIGFAMEHVTRIFQPFQRLHGRSQYEGMGMGLAICNRIAERHNGAITAISAPDQGSTFIVTLPLRQEAAPREHRASPMS